MDRITRRLRAAMHCALALALPHALAAEAETPADPPGAAGQMRLNLRTFAESLELKDIAHYRAWVQAAQLEYLSPATPGPLALSLHTVLHGAVTLSRDDAISNLSYLGRDGGDRHRRSWAYPAQFALKARLGNTTVLYGAQAVANPMIEYKDNRALPPSFRGLLVTSTPAPGITLEAGSFDRVIARGTTHQAPLTTAYGGLAVERIDFVGGAWEVDPSATVTVYAGRILPLWDRYFAAVRKDLGDAGGVRWNGEANLYVTRGRRASAAPVGGRSYSVSLTGARAAHSLTLAFQHIDSDQVFDFLAETTGFYLSNAMATDYNAPHEQSVQLRYAAGAGALGVPGMNLMLWCVAGRIGKESAEAARRGPDDPLHELYWKGGRPVAGSQRELGVQLSYTVRQGPARGGKWTFTSAGHRVSEHFPDLGFRETRLTFEIPFKVF